MTKNTFVYLCILGVSFAGCGGKSYTIGGTVEGLSETGLLTIQNNGDDDLEIDEDGSFTFATKIPSGESYEVTVSNQPDGQACEITNGTGTASDNVTNVQIICYSSKRIFLTSFPNVEGGDYGGISGADSACDTDPGKPSGTGTYKAMLVDSMNRRACQTANCSGDISVEQQDWVLAPNTAYVRVPDTVEVIVGRTNSKGLFEFPLTIFWEDDAEDQNPWTGLETDWTTSSDTCLNWTVDTSGQGTIGSASALDETAISNGTASCGTNNGRLVCVEQ